MKALHLIVKIGQEMNSQNGFPYILKKSFRKIWQKLKKWDIESEKKPTFAFKSSILFDHF